MTLQIKQYDLEIQRMTQIEHAETQPLLTIHGIGDITALTFVRMLCSMRQIIAAWSR
jgi:transposase